ncbi:hypothetical protein Tco_0321721 [Tanacetum coccineum]
MGVVSSSLFRGDVLASGISALRLVDGAGIGNNGGVSDALEWRVALSWGDFNEVRRMVERWVLFFSVLERGILIISLRRMGLLKFNWKDQLGANDDLLSVRSELLKQYHDIHYSGELEAPISRDEIRRAVWDCVKINLWVPGRAMVFKIDFAKAYDSIRWDYLGDVLKSFGFGVKGVSSDSWYLKVSSMASFLFNGFLSENGLVVLELDIDWLFTVLHTQFIYFGIMCRETCHFDLGNGTKKPINKLKMSFYTSWKLKTLSIGGRLTLLKSVLGSTPIYNMSLFKVPKAVLKSMESIRRNFFNGIRDGEKKIAWVSWSKVLASKSNGGLGVSSFYALNRGDSCLRLSYPRLFALENNKVCSVAAKMSAPFVSSLRRDVRGGEESAQLSRISDLLDTVVLSNMGDRRFWDLNGDGCFRVKDVRRSLWIVSFWVISSRGVQVSPISCPICCEALENLDHLLFCCDLAKDIARINQFKQVLEWSVLHFIGGSIGHIDHLLFSDSNLRKDEHFIQPAQKALTLRALGTVVPLGKSAATSALFPNGTTFVGGSGSPLFFILRFRQQDGMIVGRILVVIHFGFVVVVAKMLNIVVVRDNGITPRLRNGAPKRFSGAVGDGTRNGATVPPSLKALQKTKMVHVDLWMLRQVWGNTHFDFASMPARGLWIPNNVNIMWIVVYAPETLSLKIALWDVLANLISELGWDFGGDGRL